MNEQLLREAIKMFNIQSVMQLIRYLLLGVLVFWFFWIHGKEKFKSKKIQKAYFLKSQIKVELMQSMVTVVIFGFIAALSHVAHKAGYLHFYKDFNHYGPWYPFFSFFVLLVVHDAYFYWTHRLLHVPGLYERFHLAHHTSYNPTPLVLYSFHPVEAAINGAIIPFVAIFCPLHISVVAFFTFYSAIFNSIAHLGYEIYGRWFIKLGFSKWVTASLHHNLHHQTFKDNYGFYFRFWDRLMGTEVKDYDQRLGEMIQP